MATPSLGRLRAATCAFAAVSLTAILASPADAQQAQNHNLVVTIPVALKSVSVAPASVSVSCANGGGLTFPDGSCGTPTASPCGQSTAGTAVGEYLAITGPFLGQRRLHILHHHHHLDGDLGRGRRGKEARAGARERITWPEILAGSGRPTAFERSTVQRKKRSGMHFYDPFEAFTSGYAHAGGMTVGALLASPASVANSVTASIPSQPR